VSEPAHDDPYYQAEEARAALWFQQTQNRIAFQAALWQALLAPPEPRQAVWEAFEPLIMASAQKQAGYLDPEDDP
jgi:hypothetical protein